MPETKKYMRTVRVDYICDECKDGKMRPKKTHVGSQETVYFHECEQCGTEDIFLNPYPTDRCEWVEVS